MAETYEEFIAKFNKEQPKTTDDCYTPQPVYNVVLDYVCNRYGKRAEDVIRPFYPGGDFEREDYTGKVVVDNPPFSIMKRIILFYLENDIPFFLFCPGLGAPLYEENMGKATIILGITIEYNNGAKVNTSFITNMEKDVAILSDNEFIEKLKKTQKEKTRTKRKKPNNYITVADASKFAHNGVPLEIRWENVQDIKGKTPDGNGIYGKALVLDSKGEEQYRNALEEYKKNKIAKYVKQLEEI